MQAMPSCLYLVLAALSLLSATAATETFEKLCRAFKPEKFIKNSTKTHLDYVTNGTTLFFPDNVASCTRPNQTVAVNLCRIALSIPTSHRSSITFELWLPESWQGERHLSTGNGGIDGCIQYESLAYGVLHGFAVMGTNNGHNGTTGVDFYQNSDILEDYAYRALHTGTASGRLLAEKFYRKPVSRSYFLGCSLGGRMGIKGAEMFPDDYDGIVAGCPAVDFNHLQADRAMFYPITGPVNSTNFITREQWTDLIHAEVLRQCDGIDGVIDGIIDVPGRCFFKPETLLCNSSSQAGECLNGAQIEQLKKIYAPYTYSNGTLIFPRMDPGNELKAVDKLLAGAPFSYSEDWFRYVILDDPNWDALTFNESVASLAELMNPFDIRTYPRTLPSFKARGGKLLSYHGGQDNQISSFNTERFYDQMAQADPGIQNWYRFFRISGMFHCNTGPGAWVVGQAGGASSEGIPFEPQQNVLAAIVAWVEQGQPPGSLTGTKFVNDTVALGIDFQRNHCLYPKTQQYIGGDYKSPDSWNCV